MIGTGRTRGPAAVALLVLLFAGWGPSLAQAGQATPAGATPVASPTATALPWWQNAVCYEIFVRSFFDSDGDGTGDLRGVVAKLDYLNDGDPQTDTDLGVNCLWLMPVAEAASYHGYDVVDPYAIEQDYGSREDFSALVAEAERRGIRIITDLVLNHLSDEHPWFQRALADPEAPERDYFIFVAEDPGYPGSFSQDVWHPTPDGTAYYYATFGADLPDLNYRNPAVTQAAYEIARFWVEALGVDGFRLDAIKHLIEEGEIQENSAATHAWLRDFRAFLDTLAPDLYTIGEIFGANTDALLAYFPDQVTACFQFEISAGLLRAASLGVAGSLIRATAAAAAQIPDQRWAPFLTNHDQDRTMSVLGGDVPAAASAATALLTAPGLPFIYYGEEIGMIGTKPDIRIRTPMQWTAEPSGFTSGTPWEPFQDDLATVNVAAQAGDPASLLNHYRRLVRLHLASPALSHGAFVPLAAPPAIAAYLRVTLEQVVLVVINVDNEAADGIELAADLTTGLAPGDYTLVPLLGDTGAAPLAVGGDGRFTAYTPISSVPPYTGYVFELQATT